jgi:hypothetical protein
MTLDHLNALKAAAAVCWGSPLPLYPFERNGDWYVSVGHDGAVPRSVYHEALREVCHLEHLRHASLG